MSESAASARRRQTIENRIGRHQLPAVLRGEEPTWIPSAYAAGGGPARCHYCGDPIAADEALLVRDDEQAHPACEEAWRDLVTAERGE